MFVVRDERGWRELVADDGIRAMVHTRIKKTNTLVSGLPYTDGFHLAVALAGPPQRALFVGAGGAIGPRQFVAFYPEVDVDVVDVDARILSAARQFFALEEGRRLRVHVAEGETFVAGAPDCAFDVIVLDAYRGPGRLVEQLASEDFFTVVRTKLRRGGVLCTNLVDDTAHPASQAARIAAAIAAVFAGQCRTFRVPDRRRRAANWTSLAVRGSPAYGWDGLTRRARALDGRVAFAAAIARRPFKDP